MRVPPLVVAVAAAVITVEAVLKTFVLRSIPDFHVSLDRFKDVVALAVVAGVGGATVGATLGVTSYAWAGYSGGIEPARAWLAPARRLFRPQGGLRQGQRRRELHAARSETDSADAAKQAEQGWCHPRRRRTVFGPRHSRCTKNLRQV